MKTIKKYLLVSGITAAMTISAAGTVMASGGFVNSGPGVASRGNEQIYGPDENDVNLPAGETDAPSVQTNESGIPYKTKEFYGINAVLQMGEGTQITNMVLSLQNVGGNIAYDACVNHGGWQPWTFNDQPTGGTESSTYLEGIRIMPNNGLEKEYDIYYACTMSGLGKLGYAKNGEMSGAPGRGEHVIDIDIQLIPKGGEVPESANPAFYSLYEDQIINQNGTLVYTDAAYTGWLEHGDYRWYVNNGIVVTGWQAIDGYRYYFAEDGKLVQDVDSLIGKQDNYLLQINKTMNCLTVFAMDENHNYTIPVKAMVTSVGDDTPLGTFKIPEKFRWRLMVTGAYTQYATRIKQNAGFLLHSAIYDIPNNKTLWAETYNGLGVLRSLGCVRLQAGNAKWIYDNCPVGTTITVYESEVASPFRISGIIPIPVEQNYDPTDPDA